jgi:hypothetical protein
MAELLEPLRQKRRLALPGVSDTDIGELVAANTL